MEALTDHDPREVGRYRILALLGEGGMGRVYLALGPDGQRVALKRILPQFSRDPAFRQRFAREVAAAQRVSGPHLVRVVDADPTAADPWSATAFVPGPTLSQAVEAHGALPEPQVRRLGADLATALNGIHGAELIHRDVKPSNILISAAGAQLLDFGVSRAMDGSTSMALTQTGGLIGSPGFMSPEQAESRDLTEKSDVFSLGCVLAMAASGRAPFDGPSIPQILYKVVHAEPDLAGVPAPLRDTVARCLAKAPEDRPSPLELRRLLEHGGETATGPLAVVETHIAGQEAEIAALLNAPRPTLVDHGPTMMYTRWTPPPVAAPARRSGRGAVVAALAAGAALLIVWTALVWSGWGRDETPTDNAADSTSPTIDVTASAATEAAAETSAAASPADDTDVVMFVESIGAAARGLESAWWPDQAYWQYWEPFAEPDFRSIPTEDDSVGFIGIGVLDQELIPHNSGQTGDAVDAAAAMWIRESWGGEESLWSSEITRQELEIDGRPAVLGEFRLEWDDPMGNGDTGAEYALVLAELENGEVFAGFLGLFDSQLDHYDPALDVLLAVTIEG